MVKEDHLESYLNQETKSQYICCVLNNHVIYQIIKCSSCFLHNGSLVIAHLTTTTKLAAAAEKTKLKLSLPPEYANYTSVFLKEVIDNVSPFHPYNHEINLDKSCTPKIGKVYSLFPEERKTTEDFLDENLKTSKIHPLNSLQASPFFFAKKRTVVFTLVITTTMSMNTLSMMHTSFPSSPISSTNSKEQKFSPNLMFTGGIIMSILKMDTSGKPPLSLTKDFLNQP